MELTGLDGVFAGLAKAKAELALSGYVGLESGAQRIAEAWKANIVADGLVLTGRYHDSISVEALGEEATVSSDVPYGPILEYGDSRQVAHPVAQRALDDNGQGAIDAVVEKLAGVLA